MWTGSRQLADSIRTALLISACAALVAMTSGLLLTIHLLSTDQHGHHDSHDCVVCQQLLAASKKALPAPATELVRLVPAICEDAPVPVEHIQHHSTEVSPPRGPPCFHSAQSV